MTLTGTCFSVKGRGKSLQCGLIVRETLPLRPSLPHPPYLSSFGLCPHDGCINRKKSELGRPTVGRCFAVQHSPTCPFSPTPSEPIADLHGVCMCGLSLACHRRAPSKCKKGAGSLSIVPEADKRWIFWRGHCLDMPMVRIAFRQRIMRGRSARRRVTEGPLCRHCSLFDSSWGAAIRRDDGCLDDRHRPHLLRSRSAGLLVQSGNMVACPQTVLDSSHATLSHPLRLVTR